MPACAWGDLPAWVDVEQYRRSGRRVVVYEVRQPVLVLGSTQPASLVDGVRAKAAGVALARRRSGGGAVYLEPGGQEWVDIWIPRDDPCWSPEPHATAERVGEWWARGLAGTGMLHVHRGPSVPAPGDRVVCFAGIGPGEVLADGRKVVGLAQWRSREGALVHGCAYRRWDPGALLDLLCVDEPLRRTIETALVEQVAALDELPGPPWRCEELLAALPAGPPWDVRSADAPYLDDPR